MKAVRLLLLLLCLAATTAYGQRRMVAVDVETGLPLVGINVQGARFRTVTDSMGRVSIPDSCNTLLFSHVNYESMLVNIREAKSDTVLLISKLNNLGEVVVLGTSKINEDKLEELNRRLRIEKAEAQLLNSDPSKPASIPLGLLSRLLPKKWRPGYKAAQRKKRHEEVLNDY